MSEANSTPKAPPSKPEKPSPDYPLTPHPNGRWCKKVKGRLVYFGRWDDPQGALRLYQDFLAGKPRPKKKARRRKGHLQDLKPYEGFPLTAHPSGRWCKKILGRLHYFGPLADPKAAEDEWNKKKDDLLAGRVPREKQPEGATLRDLVIAFLRSKKDLLDSGELSPRTFADNHRTCAYLLEHFGKNRLVSDIRQKDFAGYRRVLAIRFSALSLGIAIIRTRSIFKFAREDEDFRILVDYGNYFDPPSKKTLRLERAQKGEKLFTAQEIRALMEKAGPQLTCMILLACNAALGNSDLANLPISAVNVGTGWLTFARIKTGIPRRVPLWPETIAALREVLARRKAPRDPENASLVFVTKQGGKWCKQIFEKRAAQEEEGSQEYRENFDDAIAKEFKKLFAKAGLERKKGCGFYTLRHCFRTVADEARDQPAANAIMGHCPDSNDMSSLYRERISDERLQAVTEHVRQWLFPDEQQHEEGPAIAGKVG